MFWEHPTMRCGWFRVEKRLRWPASWLLRARIGVLSTHGILEATPTPLDHLSAADTQSLCTPQRRSYLLSPPAGSGSSPPAREEESGERLLPAGYAEQVCS